jgi:hypothetical protein
VSNTFKELFSYILNNVLFRQKVCIGLFAEDVSLDIDFIRATAHVGDKPNAAKPQTILDIKTLAIFL